MPPHQRLRTVETPAVAYRSTACRIGTHTDCAEASHVLAPVDLPVIYETCDCPCHPSPDQPTPRPAVTR
ncbi:hypothetical protein [Streptomyces olivaceus]|uniref:hypothetical protein n=1 Tax=Streptomyces olivaceus TaxID=47716 RepID=UPI001CCB6FA1|nr:hypothetical protein [Streptomyces olivaceus]MBZ6307331.1 hypothetical protein [Streptomyces olivaceus]MBZ6321226.1 hypothetical protein [Streptomyces olivaceus]